MKILFVFTFLWLGWLTPAWATELQSIIIEEDHPGNQPVVITDSSTTVSPFLHEVYMPGGVKPDGDIAVIRLNKDGVPLVGVDPQGRPTVIQTDEYGRVIVSPNDDRPLIFSDPGCLPRMEDAMRSREYVDGLREKLDGRSTHYVTVSDGTVMINRWESQFIIEDKKCHITEEGYLRCDEAIEHPVYVPKTDDQLYEEAKAEILQRLKDLDDSREREKAYKRERVAREAAREQLEELTGELIVEWATVKRECWREK